MIAIFLNLPRILPSIRVNFSRARVRRYLICLWISYPMIFGFILTSCYTTFSTLLLNFLVVFLWDQDTTIFPRFSSFYRILFFVMLFSENFLFHFWFLVGFLTISKSYFEQFRVRHIWWVISVLCLCQSLAFFKYLCCLRNSLLLTICTYL